MKEMRNPHSNLKNVIYIIIDLIKNSNFTYQLNMIIRPSTVDSRQRSERSTVLQIEALHGRH